MGEPWLSPSAPPPNHEIETRTLPLYVSLPLIFFFGKQTTAYALLYNYDPTNSWFFFSMVDLCYFSGQAAHSSDYDLVVLHFSEGDLKLDIFFSMKFTIYLVPQEGLRDERHNLGASFKRI